MTTSLFLSIIIAVLAAVCYGVDPAGRSVPRPTPPPQPRRFRRHAHRSNNVLYPSPRHILPDIYRITDAEALVDAINCCSDQFDVRLQRIIDEHTPTFSNTVLALQAPLFEMQQLDLVVDFYHYALGVDIVPRRVRHHTLRRHHGLRRRLYQCIQQLAGRDDFDADARLLVDALLDQGWQTGAMLDPITFDDLQNVESQMRQVRQAIREWMRTHSDPDPDLSHLMVLLMKLRSLGSRFRSETDDPDQIWRRLTKIGDLLQKRDADHFWTYSEWNQAQDAYLYQDSISTERIFELDRVLFDGLFAMAADLYGLQFCEETGRLDLPYPDQRIFEVFNEDGRRVGALILGPFRRPHEHTFAMNLVLVDRCEYVNVRDSVIMILINGLPSEQTLLMSFEEVFDLSHEFGQALHHFLVLNHYTLLSAARFPAEVATIPAILHQRLASDSAVLRRIKPDLSAQQIDRILADKIQVCRLMAVDDLARAVLAHGWRYDPPQDPVDLVQYGKQVLGRVRLGFAALSWPETVEFLLQRSSAWHWTLPVADCVAARIQKWIQSCGGLSRQVGRSLKVLLLQRSLDDIETLIDNLENPNPKTLVQRWTDGFWRGSPAEILKSKVAKNQVKITRRNSPCSISIKWLRLPLCYRS